MNKIMIIGNLTRAPELRTTAAGVPVCRFCVAVNRRFTSERDQGVDFFDVVTFRKTAENCASYLAKGRKVCVVGALRINEFTDREGTRRTSVDIAADEVEFLSPRTDEPREQPKATLEPVTDDRLPF